MNPTNERPTGASRKKRYASVQELVRDLSEDNKFADDVNRGIDERNIINHLMAMRSSLDLSQQDIAQKMKCSQSRISKLETGKDDDLRIGDFQRYADALGLQMLIVLAKAEKPPIAKRIKYHTRTLERLFKELAILVADDDSAKKEMVKLVASSAIPLACGMVNILEQAGFKVPKPSARSPHVPPPIQIEMDDDDCSDLTGADDSRCAGTCRS